MRMNDSYSLVSMAEVLGTVRRSEKPDPAKEYRLLGVRLDGQGPFLREAKLGSQISATTLYQVKHGDFVYSRLFAWRGAFGIIGKNLDGCYVSGEFPTFNAVPERVDLRYLNYWFKLPTTVEKVEADCTGSTPLTRNRFKEEFFLRLQIRLPPLSEQRRIVARIEELAAKIEEAKGLRKQAVEEAERLRASSKSKLFQNAFSRRGNLRTLEEVAPIAMGQSPPGHTYNEDGDGLPLLNGPTEFGERYPKEIQWTTSPTRICKTGDILVCVRGATTGRMNWADKEYCIGRGLAALTPDPDLSVAEYVFYFVQTQTNEMLALTSGSTFPNLQGEKLKKLRIPLPPPDEQRRIVVYLEDLQSKVDALKRLQGESARELDALLPSILDKAFKGEL
jgi:type I restriction enzyme S subunit